MPLAELVDAGAALARDGVELNAQQAYVVEILADIVTSTPECAALFAPDGSLAREGDIVRQPELADALERLGHEGAAPFYTGDIAAAIVDWVGERGGLLTAADLAQYEVVDREPVRVSYRGREVAHEPAAVGGRDPDRHALASLAATDRDGPPGVTRIVEVMEQTQRARTPEFLDGLDDPAFVERFLSEAALPGRSARRPTSRCSIAPAGRAR